MGAEAGLGALAVELFHHSVEGALQIGHGDALVDDHALHLVEHGGVSGIYLILPVYPAGAKMRMGRGLVSMAWTCMGEVWLRSITRLS